jgi:beta-galactosidase
MFAMDAGNFSLPVGRVDALWVYPMGFAELLRAKGNETLAVALESLNFSCSIFSQESVITAMMTRTIHHLAKILALGALLTGAAAQTPAPVPLGKPGSPQTFAIGEADFLLGGQRLQIRCGEIHAARVPREYWTHRLKMCKAMGLNTVCAYLFWNMHEPREGQFDWSGQADAAEFCRLAQNEGLWVILRPGPYSCAEWEMGGTPWWLLKKSPISFRSNDPKYLEPAKRYLKEVGRVLAPLQVTKGGPILMVQVENEYGFFGTDKTYMNALRKAIVDAGFEVPLFDCNPTYKLGQGSPGDLFHVVNFGSNPNEGFDALRRLQPKGPLMCGEFYPGWFDTWGAPHHLGNTPGYLRDLETMLKRNGSFSIYMAHGGTTFGLWAGCDRPFKPDTSSYDYDAPISEAGWVTEKFHKTRELFARYLLPGESLGEIPPANPITAFAPVTATAAASIFSNLPAPVSSDVPRTMEAYDQGYGCILYRTTLPAGPTGQLEVAGVADFGFVYLDGKPAGVLDRRRTGAKVRLPNRTKPFTLDILVEPMGRINFGAEMNDPKGLRAPVKFAGTELKGWKVFSLPLDSKMLGGLKFKDGKASGPAFWRATVDLPEAADTFLDLRGWGKGVVWVNGHCLGRFWNIGPTQTAYAPGCWLKKGTNEVIIWDLLGPTSPIIAGLEKPILDQLRPELDFAVSRRPDVTLHLPADKPTHTGSFAPGPASQDVKFATPARGRFFCLESVDAHDGKGYAAIAELDLLGKNGEALNRANWTIAYVDSEERAGEDGSAENAIDGQTANLWHTEWKQKSPNHPHRFVIDLGASATISGFRYVPRQSEGGGRIKNFRAYVGDRLVEPKAPQ